MKLDSIIMCIVIYISANLFQNLILVDIYRHESHIDKFLIRNHFLAMHIAIPLIVYMNLQYLRYGKTFCRLMSIASEGKKIQLLMKVFQTFIFFFQNKPLGKCQPELDNLCSVFLSIQIRLQLIKVTSYSQNT